MLAEDTDSQKLDATEWLNMVLSESLKYKHNQLNAEKPSLPEDTDSQKLDASEWLDTFLSDTLNNQNNWINAETPSLSENKEECTTKDNLAGKCVEYYQCDPDYTTVIEDGSTIIDFRSEASCPHYLQVCCVLDKIITHANDTSKKTADENSFGEESNKCGWNNPALNIFKPKSKETADNSPYANYGDFPWKIALIRLLSLIIGLTVLYKSVNTYDDEDLNKAINWLNNVYDGQTINNETDINERFAPDSQATKCTSSTNQIGFCVNKELCLEAVAPVDPTTLFILRDSDKSCASSETCCLKISGESNKPTPTAKPIDSTGAKAKNTCSTDKGEAGVCVKKSLCSNAVSTVDPATLFVPRERTSCHGLEACCLESNVKTTVVKPMKPNEDVGCGWSNPGANIFREKTSANGLADYGEFPWMIALIRKENGNKGWNESYTGGGALIHPSVVITAAHKVTDFKPSEIKVRAGEWDTRTEAEVDPYQELDVTEIIIHENYEKAHALNDVALLILKSPVNLIDAPHIGVACLAKQLPPPGTRCFGMGWGTDFLNKDAYAVILKKLELPLVQASVCEKQYQGTILGLGYRLDKSLTCAGGEKGVDTCVGDGGSPLVCPVAGESERFALVGMSAYGLGCGVENLPGVYVNAPNAYDWVGRQMASKQLNKKSYEY